MGSVYFQEAIILGALLKEQKFSIDAGVGRDAADALKIRPFFSLSTQTQYGKITGEWNGSQFSLGVGIPIEKLYKGSIAIHPAASNEANSKFNKQISIGMSISENIIDLINTSQKESQKNLEANIQTRLESSMNQRLAVFEKKEDGPVPHSHLVLDHLQKGLDAFYNKNYRLALKEYLVVTTLMPDLTVAHLRLGSIYFLLGDKKSAKRSWDTALELEPNNIDLQKMIYKFKKNNNIESVFQNIPTSQSTESPVGK